jgi:FMN phosphatase YigB (HAD superfamily)
MPVTNVLLDLGGVLTVDPWQALLLTPQRGLVDRLLLDRETVIGVADEMWEFHARHWTDETSYWREMSARIDTAIPAAAVAEAEAELLVTLPDAGDALDFLSAARMPWGLITNNTAFWFEKQVALLGLSVNRLEWTFTSFAEGCQKEDAVGLFDLAAERLDPAATLVVDDRTANLERARAAGFVAEQFIEGIGSSLPELLQREVTRR